MSEPKRYDVGMTTEFNPHGFNHSFPRVYEAEEGKYVEYSDYARLKAEVEKLRKGDERDMTAAYLYAAEQSKDEIKRLKAEVERLSKKEDYHHDLLPQPIRHRRHASDGKVERLTKAGDDMAKVITEFRCGPYGNRVKNAFVVWNAWNAAKSDNLNQPD
jgi:hypothetical protein